MHQYERRKSVVDHLHPSASNGDESSSLDFLLDLVKQKGIILFKPFPLLCLRRGKSMFLISLHQIDLCSPTSRNLPLCLIKRPQPRGINMTMPNPRHKHVLWSSVVNLVTVSHVAQEFLGNGTTFVDGGTVITTEGVDDFSSDGKGLLFFPATEFTGTVCDDPVVPEEVPGGHVGDDNVCGAQGEIAAWIGRLDYISSGTTKHAIHRGFNVERLEDELH